MLLVLSKLNHKMADDFECEPSCVVRIYRRNICVNVTGDVPSGVEPPLGGPLRSQRLLRYAKSSHSEFIDRRMLPDVNFGELRITRFVLYPISSEGRYVFFGLMYVCLLFFVAQTG